MNKKILGISGSHRSGFETEKSLDFALSVCEDRGFETEKISLIKHDFSHCRVCGFCSKNPGKCSIDDSAVEIIKKMEESDGIIFASPVYFGSISGKLSNFFDRTLMPRRNNFAFKNKIATAIAVGRCRNGGQELVLSRIQAFANIHGMIFVGDDNHFGGTVAGEFELDDFGKNTIEGSANKICDVLNLVSP